LVSLLVKRFGKTISLLEAIDLRSSHGMSKIPSLAGMEYWSIGADSGKNNFFVPLNPSLHCSNIPTRPPRLSESDGGQVLQLGRSP